MAGNVRELENKIQRAVIMSESSLLSPEDLGFSKVAEKEVRDRLIRAEGHTLKEMRDKVEKDLVSAAMNRHHGNIARAAQELGISRPTLYDLMRKHGLQHVEP